MAKILIIDDEAQLCEFIKSYLEKRGYEIIISLTGKEALEVCPKENPDLVLLDLGLPDIDGRGILREIKAKMPQIKVMMISAYKDQATQDELIKLGADYFLGKPFVIPHLYELIKDIFKS